MQIYNATTVPTATESPKFAILYADPPWDYKGQTQHGGSGVSDTGGAVRHYSTMTLDELMRLDVPSITADDALLFMWSSSPHLDQAVALMRAWGFSWATVAFVWDKLRVNPGFYTMSQCELCLVGKRGRIPRPRGARNIRQLVQSERREHSQKPDEVRKRIEAMFPTQAKVELFARERVDGWSAWGNEVESSVQLAVLAR
jgi:N6-adenosine-specific RNA methylase IME4